MSELKLCRICLRSDVKVYKFDRFQLLNYYEEIMAQKVDKEDGLPHYFCYECATLLQKYHKFKEKCCRGSAVLKGMLRRSTITYELYNVDLRDLNLRPMLRVSTINKRVKTYNIVEQTENIVKTESVLNTDDKWSINYDISDCDDNYQNDSIDVASDDEEPLIKTKNGVEDEEELIDAADIEMEKNVKVITIKPRTKKYSFNTTTKHAKLLDSNHWEKINMSEEEAVIEFRARAENKKYMEAPHKCTDCFKGFSKKNMLSRHIQLRHREGVNECRFCKMRFKLDCLLRKHMRQHFSKYKCLRCHLVCHLEYTALLHEDYHNGITKKCIHCNEEFRHMSTYYTHLRTHRSDFVCSLCGASFVSNAGLHQHKKVKHLSGEMEESEVDDDDVNTFCSKCNITFETRKAYIKHVFHSNLHAGDIEYDELEDQCSAPRKMLGKKDQSKIVKELQKSDIYGTNELPLSTFKKHSRKLKKIRKKPMDCYQCGKHFDTQVACMRHHIAEHPGTSFFPATQRHICELCGASLAPGSVATHQNMHSRSKLFSCDSCDRTFHSSVSLKRHLVTHTGEKPYACSMCDKRFTQSNSMKLHYRTFHLKQPYPKRNRRKKTDEPHTTLEADDSKTSSSSDSLPDRLAAPTMAQGDTMHYLTLN